MILSTNKTPGQAAWHAAARAAASLQDIFLELQSSPAGLSTPVAERRLKDSGPNDFTGIRLRSQFVEYLRASFNPLIAVLLIAGSASAFLGETANAAIIGAIVVLSSGLNAWQTFKSAAAMRRLKE